MRSLLFLLCLLFVTRLSAQSQVLRVVNNLDGLLTNNPAQFSTNVMMLGYYTPNDGGGGIFSRDMTSTSSTNYGTVFRSNYPGASSGRLLLQWNDSLSLLQFGAIATTNQTNHTTGVAQNNIALTNALAVLGAHGGGELVIPPGYYNISIKPIILPQQGANLTISGVRRDASILHDVGGAGSFMVGGGSAPAAGGYLFRNFTISGQGNNNAINAIVITNDANRELRFEMVGVHQFSAPGSIGLTIDGVHSILGDVKLDYNDMNFAFGLNQFLNASELCIISENARTNAYSGVIANSAGVTLTGTYESSGPILVTNCVDVKIFGYFENNLPGSLDLIHNKRVTVNSIMDGTAVNDYGVRLGDNDFPSLGSGYEIKGLYQFLSAAVVIGGPGLIGPRSPILEFTTFAIQTNILFESNLQAGTMQVRLNGVDYCYDLAGHILYSLGAPITGGLPVIADFSGATNYALALPVTTSVNRPFIGTNKAGIVFDKTLGRALWTADGGNYNVIGSGDGSVAPVGGGTGVVNTVTKWTGNGFQLSTNSLIRENGSSVIINSTNEIGTSTKLYVSDGGTNDMLGTSATFIVRNGGISTNANIVEFQSNTSGGTPLLVRNAGGVALPLIGAGKLLRTDASSNIAEVTSFSGITWDGTTLTATGGPGPGATNAYNQIKWNTTNITQRTTLNFEGLGVSNIVDSGGITVVTLDKGGPGTVTSVGLTMPSAFSVSGSPVTTAGTLSVTANGNQPYYFLSGGFGGEPVWDNSLYYSNADNTISAVYGAIKRGRTGSATNSPASGGILGQFRAGGWNQSGYVLAPGWRGLTTEAWTPSANGSKITFFTVANGAAVTTDSLTIDQNGQVIPLVSATPTTDAAGGFAFDSNAWAASRGALQLFDGTANTYLLGALASDTPSNGQVPTWNTGGTITWETPSTGSSANWVSSGTTNATLPGIASTYGLVVTNTATFNGDVLIGSTNAAGAIAGKQPVFTTGAGVTNVSNVLSVNLAAGSNITFTTNSNGQISIAGTASGSGTTNGLAAYQTIGAGTDFVWGSDNTYEKIVFGTTGPSFTLTNAGAYQIILSIGGLNNNTGNQVYYVTNVTDHVMITGVRGMQISSTAFGVIPVTFQVTTTGASRSFELWGLTTDSTYGDDRVVSTNTVLDVIYFGNPTGAGSDNWTASGTTNSVLPGLGSMHALLVTNSWLATGNRFFNSSGILISNTFVAGNGGQNITTNAPFPVDPLVNESNGTYAGQQNTYVGMNAGLNSTSGNGNTYYGYRAGELSTVADQNTFIGWAAGALTIDGYHNTYVGVGAGQDDVHGTFNVMMGCDSGLHAIDGNHNVIVGSSAGSNLTTDNNTVVGYAAGTVMGTNNVFIGNAAGSTATGADMNVGIGSQALATSSGKGNIGIGYKAGFSLPATNATGGSTFIGWEAGLVNTTGSSNTFLGYQAGHGNTTGNLGTFVGGFAGLANTTGSDNTFVGYQSGLANTTGVHNTAVGYQSLAANTTAANSVAIGDFAADKGTGGALAAVGYQALFNSTTGANNSALGNTAGLTLVTGAGNTFIGRAADVLSTSSTNLNNSTALGAGAIVTNSNQIVIGNTSVTEVFMNGAGRSSSGIFGGPNGSGANAAGGSIKLDAGASTGTGAGGSVELRTSLSEAASSTVNSLQPRFHAPSKYVALTHATATSVIKFSLAANKVIQGELTCMTMATNSTPHAQSLTSKIKFQAVAIGTTITGTVDQTDGTTAASSGTLTAVFTLVDNGDNTFTIKDNASSSLSSPTERCYLLASSINGSDVITITEF